MDAKELARKTGIGETVIREIRRLAEKYGVRKVILFGSRARGDFRERSDIDLAFAGGDAPLFALDVDEETSTLLMFDIVNLDEPAHPELLESIRRDGIALYERVSKFDNFSRALDNLRDIYRYEEPYGNVELSGMVALFEICFEQAWKAMKEALDRSGYREGKTGSPKLIIKTAHSAEMIENQELWLRALADRNHVAHAYNEAVARGIVRNAKESYYEMFRALRETMEKDWL